MGGGKGGSDFDPKGKSDGEIRRFCVVSEPPPFRSLASIGRSKLNALVTVFHEGALATHWVRYSPKIEQRNVARC